MTETGPYVIYAPSARGPAERGSVEWRADRARSRWILVASGLRPGLRFAAMCTSARARGESIEGLVQLITQRSLVQIQPSIYTGGITKADRWDTRYALDRGIAGRHAAAREGGPVHEHPRHIEGV